MAMLILLVCSVTGGIYFARYVLRFVVGKSNAQLIASIANSLLIQFFNYIYNLVAFALTDRENHRYGNQFSELILLTVYF